MKPKPALRLSSYLVGLCLISSTCREQSPSVPDPGNPSSQNELYLKYHLDKIKLPPGFSIEVFAEIPDARSLCLGEKGTVFVGNREGNKVYAIEDRDKNGKAEKVHVIASGLETPCGVAFKDGDLYVAEISRILRFDDIESRLQDPPQYNIVYDRFPSEWQHGWKFIAFGPDEKLYVPVGAPCNVCHSDSVYASITRMNADGTGFEIFSHGIRNTVGFSWHPQTGELWFTDNGRDNMGDNVPADELNIAGMKGMHFGFPFCHQGNVPDPKYGKDKSCDQFIPPALTLGPHVAALGMRFYTGNMFPGEYKDQVFIAEHGSWNRTSPIGYRVMQVKTQNNKPVQYIPFATGWLTDDGKVLGRPVDVLVAPDGALLVSDDKAGAVYRISYRK